MSRKKKWTKIHQAVFNCASNGIEQLYRIGVLDVRECLLVQEKITKAKENYCN